jgi:hypothetical protein
LSVGTMIEMREFFVGFTIYNYHSGWWSRPHGTY